MERVFSDPEVGWLAFGPFELAPSKRLLVRNGAPVEIGGRALDLLVALVEQAGRVVSKRELFERVWPGRVVEDASLRFHMANLRKLLGDGEGDERLIATQVGVGYAFVGTVRTAAAVEPAPPAGIGGAALSLSAAGALPARTRLIGREADVRRVLDGLAEPRLFTVVGPGGMGKTSLVIDVGCRLASEHGRNVRFVDLAALADGALIPSALAGALGIPVQTEDPMSVLLGHIQARDVVLILDNCEHLVDAVCAVAERIREAAPKVSLLATSREPLRARDEHIHWLGALAFPSDTTGLSLQEILAFPAVELFVERASAANSALEVGADEARTIAQMCERLDGMALAIELAAVRAAAHGLETTGAMLGERFALGWAGRRTAQPRQQTLQATLDWSYGLLSPTERRTLERLSVFRGAFSLRAALPIVSDGDLDEAQVVAAFEELASKCLVTPDRTHCPEAYRLLETTRAYARAKLDERGAAELDVVRRRHAVFFRDTLAGLGETPEEIFAGAAMMSGQIGNIRDALEWGFGPKGDLAVAASLVAAGVPLFAYLSLFVECRAWCERAVRSLGDQFHGTAMEMELQAALGLTIMFTRGNAPEAGVALRRALDIAVALGDRWNQLRLLGRLHIFHERVGEFEQALAWAEQAVDVAERVGHPEAIGLAASLAGVSHHLFGDQARARRELEISLQKSAPSQRSRTLYYGFDHRNRSGIALARVLWLQGLPDQARRLAVQTEIEAIGLDHPVTRCIALIWSHSIYVWTGDEAQAQASLDAFAEIAEVNGFVPYIAAALGQRGVRAIETGRAVDGVAWIEESLARLHAARYELLTTTFELALAQGLLICDRLDDALHTVDATLARCRANGEAFALPELLRLRARIVGQDGAGPQAEAERLLVEALNTSREQGARAWELRAALDLARLWLAQGRTDEAPALLTPLRDAFVEGLDTADLRDLERLWGLLQEAMVASKGP
ncbi:winged helix-turn-helix domain-containing protein [Caulobacter sp. UNC279MFTsu5.1]|uniref:ATP-binding protein n=1 Tax=Caulobacter sp. UNC279MFTsu5.1 TaxID=1502775 RepID=UPI000379661D|nr:winged helix-turn-helix domain-containing protein [Caulobacter sp. UNC279MFTsu5.1]SFK36917.1 Predicted ATPase [Caulobacter sp. UNC279MFTsu5.1]